MRWSTNAPQSPGDPPFGAAQAQQWASAMNCQLTQIPVIEYVTQTIALPLA